MWEDNELNSPPPLVYNPPLVLQLVWAVPVVLFKLWRQSELKHRQEFARVRGAFIYDTVYTKYPSLEPRTQLR